MNYLAFATANAVIDIHAGDCLSALPMRQEDGTQYTRRLFARRFHKIGQLLIVTLQS